MARVLRWSVDRVREQQGEEPGPSPSPTRPTGATTSSTCSPRRCARSTWTRRCCWPSRWRPPRTTPARRLEPGWWSPCTTWAGARSTPPPCGACRQLRDHRLAGGHRAAGRHRLRRGGVRPRPPGGGRRPRPPRPRGAGGAGGRVPAAPGVHRRQGGAVLRHRRVHPGAAARPPDRGAADPGRVRGHDPAGDRRDDRRPAPGRPLGGCGRRRHRRRAAGGRLVPPARGPDGGGRAGAAHRHRRPPQGRHRLRRPLPWPRRARPRPSRSPPCCRPTPARRLPPSRPTPVGCGPGATTPPGAAAGLPGRAQRRRRRAPTGPRRGHATSGPARPAGPGPGVAAVRPAPPVPNQTPVDPGAAARCAAGIAVAG